MVIDAKLLYRYAPLLKLLKSDVVNLSDGQIGVFDRDMYLTLACTGCDVNCSVKSDVFADMIRSGGQDGKWDIDFDKGAARDQLDNKPEGNRTLLMQKDKLKLKLLTFAREERKTSRPAALISIDALDLKNALKQVSFAVSTLDTSPILKGVCLKFDKVLECAATDGFKLAVSKAKYDNIVTVDNQEHSISGVEVGDDSGYTGAAQLRFVLGQKSLQVLTNLLDKGAVYLGRSGEQVVFWQDGWELSLSSMAGQFPSYEQFFVTEGEKYFVCDAKELGSVIAQAEIIVRDSQIVTLDFDENQIEIQSAHVSLGLYKNVVAGHGNKKDRLNFRPNLLNSVLAQPGQVKIYLKNTGPIVFEYSNCKYAVLPLR